MSEMRLSQVSVPLPPDLRSWIEAQAAAQDRSVAGQIRHLVAEAARAADRDRDGGDHAVSPGGMR